MADENTNNASEAEEKPGFLASFFGFDNLKSLSILIIAIFAFRWSVVSPYHVPTASMEPTIKVGDRLLAFKLAYNFKVPFTDITLFHWGTPRRGDIIVFKYPEDPDVDYVKRVIGIAGDKIQMIDDIIYINGEKQERTSHDFDRSILKDIEDEKEIKLLYREKLSGMDHWVIQNTPDPEALYQKQLAAIARTLRSACKLGFCDRRQPGQFYRLKKMG